MVVAASQFELITDDPRTEDFRGVMAELRDFYQTSKEMGGLLTMTQAGKILGVPSSQISTWVSRGRISSKEFLGVRMVSGGEVIALHKERAENIRCSGGRGKKAPTLGDMVTAAMEDFAKSE